MTPANRLFGPLADPTADAGWEQHPQRVGFFTDTSVCIGCKACEVACKEWNHVPEDGLTWTGMSYDNTGALGASTWRHVAFIEQAKPLGNQRTGTTRVDLGMPTPRPDGAVGDVGAVGDSGVAGAVRDVGALGDAGAAGPASPSADLSAQPGYPVFPNLDDRRRVDTAAVDTGFVDTGAVERSRDADGQARADAGGAGSAGPGPLVLGDGIGERGDLRWLMSSDVCKHCTHAACLDVCPTGALFRTEHGTVVVQADVCNGCGYCIPACPYGVIERREGPAGDPHVGVAQKCTLCYDRIGHDETPACAKACPTQSIQFGPLDELRERAAARVEALHEAGVTDARLYGEDPDDGVGGDGAFFLLLDEPEVYGFPPDPVVCTASLPQMYKHAGMAAAALVLAMAAVFTGGRR